MWFVIVFSIIALLGLSFNGLILYSVIKHKILRQRPYALLVSLAVCDLFKVVVLVNITIYSTSNALFDLCVITSSIGMTLIGVTTFHLAAESLNRCLIILFPYTYLKLLKKGYVAMITLLLWILPMILSLVVPYALFEDNMISSLRFQAHMFGCIETKRPIVYTSRNANSTFPPPPPKHDDDELNLSTQLIYFAIPLLIMMICYTLMLKFSYKTAKSMRGLHIDNIQSSPAIITESTYSIGVIDMVKSSVKSIIVPATIYMPQNIQHKRRTESIAAKAAKELRRLIKDRKREIKASKTALIIITAFVVCNAPIFAVTWVDHDRQRINRIVRQVLVAIAFLQIFIDPVIYFARLRDFKNARRKAKRVGTTIVRKATRRF